MALPRAGAACRPGEKERCDCRRPRRRPRDLERRCGVSRGPCAARAPSQIDALCGARASGYSRSHIPTRQENLRAGCVLPGARRSGPAARPGMRDFTQLADLAAERLGGRVLEANDDFFAPRENLLKESKPIFIEGKYTSHGKWMDGWESRRRRTPGFDWCLVRLGLPGIIRGVLVDTSFFTGNYPERFALDGCDLGGRHPYESEKQRLHSEKTEWVPIFAETSLKGDSRNLFEAVGEQRFTHLRFRIFPDGGVARLRVYGEVIPDLKTMAR